MYKLNIYIFNLYIYQYGVLSYVKLREFAIEYSRVLSYEYGKCAVKYSCVYHEYEKFALE